MSELIVIVIAVAISIISSVVQANNKKKAAAAQKQGIPEQTPEDPWEDIVRRIQGTMEEPVADAYEEIDDEEKAIERLKQARKEEIRRNREASKKIVAAKSEDNFSIPMQQEPGEPMSDIAENFNIRDAVLYSEILKPKFKE